MEDGAAEQIALSASSIYLTPLRMNSPKIGFVQRGGRVGSCWDSADLSMSVYTRDQSPSISHFSSGFLYI